jgi:hypothetical protein
MPPDALKIGIEEIGQTDATRHQSDYCIGLGRLRGRTAVAIILHHAFVDAPFIDSGAGGKSYCVALLLLSKTDFGAVISCSFRNYVPFVVKALTRQRSMRTSSEL